MINELEVRKKVVEEAKSWVGTPHRHYTMKKGLGVDCGLFIMSVYDSLGMIKAKMPEFYPHDWAYHKPVGEVFLDIIKKYSDEIPKEQLKLGDMIVYKFGKCISHGAILIEGNMVVHSAMGVGVTITNRENTNWFKRERLYFSYKGFRNGSNC